MKTRQNQRLKCLKNVWTNFITCRSGCFVGDSENDILPAKQLGMFSVHVTYGYGKLQEKFKQI